MKLIVEDDKVKDKISEEDKIVIMDKCKEIIEWLDKMEIVDKEDYEVKQKELEIVCNFIIIKFYQSVGGVGGVGGMFGGGMFGGFFGVQFGVV